MSMGKSHPKPFFESVRNITVKSDVYEWGGAGRGQGREVGRGVEGAFVKTSYELLKIILRVGGIIGLDHGQI